jgi:hypothetical protein
MASSTSAVASEQRFVGWRNLTDGCQLWQTHDVVLFVVRCIYFFSTTYHLWFGSFFT